MKRYTVQEEISETVAVIEVLSELLQVTDSPWAGALKEWLQCQQIRLADLQDERMDEIAYENGEL